MAVRTTKRPPVDPGEVWFDAFETEPGEWWGTVFLGADDIHTNDYPMPDPESARYAARDWADAHPKTIARLKANR